MPKHKAIIIVNPNADLGRAWRAAADLRPVVEEYGGADWTGTVYPTHATELARRAGEEGYELVLSAGGDGTAHEIVNGLMQLPPEQRPRLGVLPLGTGNDFAHAAGFVNDPAQALRQAFTGQVRRIDIGRLQDEHGRVEYWDNALGIGFDTIVTIRSRRLTYLRGFMVYMVAVLQSILLDHIAPRIQVTSDGESWADEMLLLVLANGPREGGGFHVAPGASASDGIFNYAAIRNVSRLRMLRLLPEVMKGTHGRFKDVRLGKFQKLSLQSDQPLIIHTDGEIYSGFGGNVRHLDVELLPGAIEVVS